MSISKNSVPRLEPVKRAREYILYQGSVRERVVYEYLFHSRTHRWLDKNVIDLNPDESRGYQAMGILHFIGLKDKHKGIFKDWSIQEAIKTLAQQNSDFSLVIQCLHSFDEQDRISLKIKDNFNVAPQRQLDGSLFKIFDKDIYDVKKMAQQEAEKEKHKEAWTRWSDIIKQALDKVDNDFDVISHRWIIGQYLLKYFWYEIKHKDRKDSASSISFSIDKEQVKVYLEWNRKQSSNSVNSLKEHNHWVKFIHSWTSDYDIDLNEYSMWVVNDNPKPITLNQFLNDFREARLKLQQREQNNTFSFRVGVIVPRKEFLELDKYETKLVKWLIQLRGIYPYTFGNSYDDEFGTAIYEDIEGELTEGNLKRFEGTVNYYYGKRYERDPINRRRAIEIHGLSCKVCGFNFEEVYGKRGKDFIEVHHIKPLSTLEKEAVIDPEQDLVPVCANCHRMIHRRKDDVLNVKELRNLIKIKNYK